jgi:hypothetical protein
LPYLLPAAGLWMPFACSQVWPLCVFSALTMREG